MNKQSREFSRNNQTTNSRNDSDSALASHRLNAEIVLFLFLPETRQNHSLLVWLYRIPNFEIPEFAAKIMLLEDHNSALRMDYIESIFTSFFSTSDRRCRLLRFPCCSLPSERIILGVSIGHFLSNLAMISYAYPALGEKECVSMITQPNSLEISFLNPCLLLVVYLVLLFLKYKNGLPEYLSFDVLSISTVMEHRSY